MRLGIFGGTFDPVHFGHLVLAEQCREQCRLDEVRFMPCGQPPHKQRDSISAARVRLEMLELATAGHPGFTVDRRELDRDGPSYTVDTLQELHDEEPQRELFFLIGADSLGDLPMWREPRRIAQLATIVAVNRGDRPLPDQEPLRPALGEQATERLQIVEIPGIDVSSTDLRQRVKTGRSIRYLVPRPVEEFIRSNGLYR